MILFWGCKKEEIIHYDEFQNLRINQVQFYGSGWTGDNTIIKRVMKYYYGENPLMLQKIEKDSYDQGEEFTPQTSINMISIVRDANILSFRHSLFDNGYLIWNGSVIYTNPDGNVYHSKNKETDWLIPIRPAIYVDVQFNSDSLSRFESVLLEDNEIQHAYKPMQLKVTEYNSHGDIQKATSVQQFTAAEELAPNARDTFEFRLEFEYQRAQEVPGLLKRMVNEELLQINKYGVVNYEVAYLSGNDYYKEGLGSTQSGIPSNYGEGNWLVTFGLPQNFIIEPKSEYMVSKRTTHHYRILPSGEREFIKTIVEDFPYVHDADAKTLEIAGLKIWYELVDVKQ